MTERATSLLAEHRRLGAKLTNFGGWDMPLQYTGVIAEHNAVRTEAGLFDVSHLGKLTLTGADAGRALGHAVSSDIAGLEVGRARYGLVLTDDGGCVDDVFVYRLADMDWLVVPNASNVDAVADAIRSSGGRPTDAWDRWAILALQGPRAHDLLGSWLGPDADQALGLKLHRFTTITVHGVECLVARTGYTGERGFELYVPCDAAPAVWADLLEAGAVPAGLGARDTLRLEMGYALYGHELTLEINPLEAGLGWAVAWDADFRGRDALAKVREEGPARRLFGIRCTGRGVPRSGFGVSLGGEPCGYVTSGNFSPTLGTGIALALGPSDGPIETGAEVAIHVEGRGREIAGVIVEPPFVGKR